jgi:hypothetical protein
VGAARSELASVGAELGERHREVVRCAIRPGEAAGVEEKINTGDDSP